MLVAHVKWFVDEITTSASKLTMQELALVTGFIGVGLLLLYKADWLIKGARSIAKYSKKAQFLREWLPTLVRVSLATILLFSSFNSNLFVPNISAGGDSLIEVLIIISSILGGLFLLGLATRLTSLSLIAVVAISCLSVELEAVLEHLELVALSIYLLIEGSGRFSVDRAFGYSDPIKLSSFDSSRIIILGAGISFSILGLTEKLIDLDLSLSFLADNYWNFLAPIGFSDRGFVIFIGASELLIGLALLLNFANRLIVAILLGLFITTGALLGISEVVGHIWAVPVVIAAWIQYDIPHMKRPRS